jgi:hypothetical protein
LCGEFKRKNTKEGVEGIGGQPDGRRRCAGREDLYSLADRPAAFPAAC